MNLFGSVRLSSFGSGSRPDLADFGVAVSRETLIQSGRIVVIDDERPPLIDALRKAGFAVDHDRSGNDLSHYGSQIYDVALIDYHGVGRCLGAGQGLDLLRYIRRVSPRTRVIAYTWRRLSAAEPEFFRLSHAVLPKDSGLGHSLALVEDELRKAHGKEHLFEAMLSRLAMSNAQEREQLLSALLAALRKGDSSVLKKKIIGLADKAAAKAVEIIVTKLFG